MALGLAAAALGPTLPSLANNTGSALGQMGILFSARSLGTLLGAWRGGGLFDRWSGNPLIAGVLLVEGTLTVLIGTIATGLFMASIFPNALAFAERRVVITGRVTGWFFTAGSAGAMNLPWLVGHMFALHDPRVFTFMLLADLTLALVLLVILILSNSQPIMKSDYEHDKPIG